LNTQEICDDQVIFGSSGLTQIRSIQQHSSSKIPFMKSGCSSKSRLGEPVIPTLLGCFLLSFTLQAAENHWTGAAGDNLWITPMNWSLGVIPDSSQDVFIEETATNGVLFDDSAAVASLTVGGTSNSAILNVSKLALLTCSGASLIRTGAVMNLDGAILGNGTWTVDGTINWNNGFPGTLWRAIMEIRPAGTLNLNGVLLKVLDGSIRNAGIVSCSAPLLEEDSASHFVNSNLFILRSNLTVNGSSLSSFQNFGAMELPPGNGTTALTTEIPLTNRGAIVIGTNTTLEVHNVALAAFENGSVFDGPGTIRFLNDGLIVWDGMLTLNTSMEYFGLGGGGISYWTGPGLFQWMGSASLGDFTFAPGFQVVISGSSAKTIYGNCTNLSTMYWRNTTSFLFFNGNGMFNNSGTLTLETDLNLSDSSGPTTTFYNPGSIVVPTNLNVSLKFSNGAFTNNGRLSVGANSILQVYFDSGAPSFEDGTVFDGSGIVRIPNDQPFNWSGTITLNCDLEYEGQGYFGLPYWTGPGLFKWLANGVLGSATFGPGFQVEASGPGLRFLTGTCTNLGVVRWISPGSLFKFFPGPPAEFNNHSQFIVTADAQWDPDTVFVNHTDGTVEQSAGAFAVGAMTNRGALKLKAGTLDVAHGFVTFAGASYELALGGNTPVTDFHQLTADNLALGGSLSVTFTNGFVPTNGASFTFANNDTLQTGQFANTTLPPLPANLFWQLQYLPNAVVLRAVSAFDVSDPRQTGNGAFQFTLLGPAATAYEVQASSNLLNWVTIGTNSPFPGMLIFTDTNASKLDRRFYRGRIFE
jgi:hypothetical protein